MKISNLISGGREGRTIQTYQKIISHEMESDSRHTITLQAL